MPLSDYDQMMLDALLEQGDIGAVGKQAEAAQTQANAMRGQMAGNTRMDWASQLARAISGYGAGTSTAEAKGKRSEVSDKTLAFVKALRARQAAQSGMPAPQSVMPAPQAGQMISPTGPPAPAYPDTSGFGLRPKQWPQGW